MKSKCKIISKLLLFAACLLIAFTADSQERQIKAGDTSYLIPAWRLRVALEKFAHLAACQKRLDNMSQQINYMQSREINRISIAQTDSSEIKYIKKYNLDLIQINKQQEKKIRWLKLQRIGFIALIIIVGLF